MKTKEFRQVNIEGCEIVGRGAHGTVYKLSHDEVVKVYREDIPLSRIQMEKEKSRRALILGLPTAISYDIVRVGSTFGAVYELIDAVPTDRFIAGSRENLDRFIAMSTELLKFIHTIRVSKDEFPDMKADHLSWIESTKDLLGDDMAEDIRNLAGQIPDSATLLHGDFHMKNIIICRGEPMLIDMDTLCFGDPVFDLSTISNSYHTFPAMDPAAATMYLGISVRDAEYIWKQTLSLYHPEMEKDELEAEAIRCRILGCLRILDFAKRGGDPAHSDLMIRSGISFLSSLLGRQ